MEEFFEEFYLQASRPAPPPPSPTSTTSSPRKSFTSTSNINTNDINLPYSLPTLLFHRTLNPRINNKHQDVARAKIKSAIERELREEKLRDAACRGDCDKIINLLVLTPIPDINRADDKGRTPLHFACAGGHIDAVKLLISRGANVNADADVVGNRPLHLAVISNKLECVVTLLEAVIEIEEREVFRQVLQITKILRHYISLQSDSADQEKSDHEENIMMTEANDKQDAYNNPKASPYSTVETLDSLTEQLSQLAMTSEENNSSGANRNNIVDSDSQFRNQSLTMTTTIETKTTGIPSKFLSAQDANVLNQVQSVLDTLIIQNKI
ncbi:4663_t:CDS:2 [Ambispora gerdemannii]|uniref:4663_t:CDS:1 n=1 Tax=Ambispora gerdemannii TaxID=144530 RepID=A0A9N8ZST5_9GLOM|nr:4663_t:CDS:2 [Ambispora gerdemannii]